MKKLIAAFLSSLLLIATLVSTASAGKVALTIQPNDPSFGDTIAVVAINNNADQVWVRVDCYADETTLPFAQPDPDTGIVPSRAGELILDTFVYVGNSSGISQDEFVTLSNPPTYWTGGGADCVLQLWRTNNWRPTNVTFEFTVAP